MCQKLFVFVFIISSFTNTREFRMIFLVSRSLKPKKHLLDFAN